MEALQLLYPALRQLDTEGQALLAQARRIEAPAGTVLFRQGDPCEQFVIVVSGQVKVLGRSAAGREMVLYRIEQQGTCVLTTSCLLGHQCYPAEGIVEQDLVAYLLPLSAFEAAMQRSPVLRGFIFENYSHRLADLIGLVQAIAFERIEQRLARHLLQHQQDGVIEVSHQQLADELGSAREVVSRQLKQFSDKGWISSRRGHIELLHAEGLTQLAEE